MHLFSLDITKKDVSKIPEKGKNNLKIKCRWKKSPQFLDNTCI